ncbi:MAG: hypothetical protein C0412_09490 [Flavobacterium sp.]|nr:hypothetical protein [Flavobacterium sp.]
MPTISNLEGTKKWVEMNIIESNPVLSMNELKYFLNTLRKVLFASSSLNFPSENELINVMPK